MSTLLILELLASCLLALYLTFAISVHYSSCSCVCLHLAVVLVQQSSMGADAATGPQGPVHLVVLQHGLWGNTTDVSNLETLLRQQLRPQDAAADGEDSKHGPAADAVQQMHEEVQILNSDVNRKALTYDGKQTEVDCSHRRHVEIPQQLCHCRPVDPAMSDIVHSRGDSRRQCICMTASFILGFLQASLLSKQLNIQLSRRNPMVCTCLCLWTYTPPSLSCTCVDPVLQVSMYVVRVW